MMKHKPWIPSSWFGSPHLEATSWFTAADRHLSWSSEPRRHGSICPARVTDWCAYNQT